MYGFPYHHDQSPDAHTPSLHTYNSLAQVSSSLQRNDTNIECFQGIPFLFQSKECNAISSIGATIIGSEVPPPSLLCVLNKSIDDPNTYAGVTTQMPKRKKKNNSKVASRKNDDKRMKMEERQTPDTTEKGYVHVRARRGQATDSHSLAERVRREKIGERMQFLQSLVPGCDKIAGKAQVLDEIINYVQSLQTQVQILMAKHSVLSRYEANLGGIIAPPATIEGICRVETSLSCMLESSCNMLHFTDDSKHESLVSASSSSSLTSQGEGEQKYFISQSTEEVPLWETDVHGHMCAMDQYWLDHYLAQLE